jgi:tetratricopeptide (TPR) repeat protein
MVGDRHDMAVTNYNSAIRRRSDFFYYHLQRGLAKKELGQTDAAIVDLQNSIDLLPTAPAHFALGGIAEGRGHDADAIRHYKLVAKSGGDYGKAATVALVKLELPTNPGTYVQRRCDADSNGNLVVSVKNNTSVRIEGVQISIQYTDSAGSQRQVTQAIRGQIGPGQVASVNTGLGPFTGSSCPAQVIAARVAG